MPDTKNNKSLTTTQTKAILEKTPAKYIKSRPGRGNKQLSYVETGYIIKKLNETFNYLWSFDVIDEKQEGNQVSVKGKLTAYLTPELAISKSQFGTYEIKEGQTYKTPLGDAYKSAASDALKKCASLFGIASDVFWQEDDSIPETSGAGSSTSGMATSAQKILIKKLMDTGKVEKDYAKLDKYTFDEARKLIADNG